MSRASSVASRGIVNRYADAVPQLNRPGDFVTVVRTVPRLIAMRCPDGCGEIISVNLDSRTGPAWRTFEKSDGMTIYPSVWRESGCRAHFIVWRNQLLWCDTWRADPQSNETLVSKVYAALPLATEGYRHFEDLSSSLGEIPWEVLWACRSLERAARATSVERGTQFRAGASDRSRQRLLDVKA